jgi:hypothetical protein
MVLLCEQLCLAEVALPVLAPEEWVSVVDDIVLANLTTLLTMCSMSSDAHAVRDCNNARAWACVFPCCTCLHCATPLRHHRPVPSRPVALLFTLARRGQPCTQLMLLRTHPVVLPPPTRILSR